MTGEWSSRAMAKLYVEEADALATATYNSADVLLGFGAPSLAEEETSLEAEEAPLPARQVLEVVEEAPAETHMAGVRTSLSQVLSDVVSGVPSPKARVPYGTKQVGKAEGEARDRHPTPCCPELRDGNPLRQKELTKCPGAVEAIDALACGSAESVQKMLCVRFDMHPSCREVEKFRQPRFKAAGGRTAFIASHCEE